MSIIFTPMNIGKMEVKNRFVRSPTCEGMAKENGEVTDKLVKTLGTLAKGEIGLILPGYMYIHPSGQAFKHQTGIYSDNLIPGLKKLVDAVHEEDGKIAFQIVHAGQQTSKDLIGTIPLGPSKSIMNPVTLSRPKQMSEEEIEDSIQQFVEAAIRVAEAGADAVQLHGAHGYLINQFLSPFYNRRKDEWGGTEENRFKYLKEIIIKTKQVLPRDMPLFIKLNTHDYTQKEGITPSLAVKYAEWLKNLGIDAIEISCGSAHFAIFNLCRGDVPVKEIIQFLPPPLKSIAVKIFQDMVGKYNFEGPYNLEAAKIIKPVLGDIPLILVGGIRKMSEMEEILEKKYADFISMSRPFIREPFLVKNFKEGKQDEASCISCNRCLAALPNDFPALCYVEKFPESK